ncbi:HNH endonuclease family protein [Bradyrhizobium symbiodeficiens]|uniref:HNH endonuclease n=1 Tax=Bradyrhizobium symbiodeficiens TaxID=1404367 RepID=A0A6G9A8I6_9BRAD|nr:HNH endonuclease [Bradyrhizobium symbiodeficiens]QIP08523.1 hypothetical protein HAV00_20680 [Bradyrhizobium symbiodeficiens]
MDDYSLVPVEHQPDFENASLVPVDHDPFGADDVTQQAPSQQAQSQPAQPSPQQPATGVGRLYVGPAAKVTQAPEESGPWDPDTGHSYTSGPDRSAASTSAQAKPAYDWSHFNQPFGELKPATFPPTQQIGHLAADGLIAAGMQPYFANDLTKRIGALLGLTPLGVAGSALDLIDAKRRDNLPGAVAAATGLIPSAKGVGSVAAKEASTLTNKVRLSPAEWATKKGFPGIGTTANGGPTFAATAHLYPAAGEQRSVVRIRLTGSRKKDSRLANKEGKFASTPEGYRWHHVDDFDPLSGEATFELVSEKSHNATLGMLVRLGSMRSIMAFRISVEKDR